jgi:hypothetical protein
MVVALYLLFCVYRLHKVVSEATGGAYPISPARGTFFNLIPVFNLYWVFRWTNEIAGFLNHNSKTRMPVGWVGVFLLAAGGLAFIDWALFFAVAFLIVGYVSDKVRTGLTLSVPSRRNTKMISASVSAGFGAASGILIMLSVIDFAHLPAKEKRLEILAILVVAFIVVRFLEPIAERFRVLGHPPSGESEQATSIVGFIRIYLLFLVAGTSVAHGLLHVLAEKSPEFGPILAIPSLIIPGGITYCWFAGARCSPPRARLYGLISGALLSCAYSATAMKLEPEAFSDLFGAGPESFHWVLLGNALGWAFLGFAGGLVIDKGWGAKRTRGILLGLLAGIGAIELSILVSKHAVSMTLLGPVLSDDLPRAVGWGVALMLDPNADALFASTRPVSSSSTVRYQRWATVSLWLLLSCAVICWVWFLRTPMPQPASFVEPWITQVGCAQELLKNPSQMTLDEFSAVARSSNNTFKRGTVYCLAVVVHPKPHGKVWWDWIFENGYGNDEVVARMFDEIDNKEGTEKIWKSVSISTAGNYRVEFRFDDDPVLTDFISFEVRDSGPGSAGPQP